MTITMKSINRTSVVLSLFALIAISLLLVGCGPKKQTADETAFTSVPVNVRVEVNHESMRVMWDLKGSDNIAGYNIYISETPLAAKYPDRTLDKKIIAHNTSPYPGDTDPDDGVIWYEAGGLADGVRYYVTVRAVYSNWTLSKSSNEVEAVCGPRGTLDLGIRYQGKPDGFSFAGNDYVDADNIQNDLYFFSKNDVDIIGSPSKLEYILRKNTLTVLPNKGDLTKVAAEVTGKKITAKEDQVEVKVGDWVLLQTVEGGHVLLRVDDLTGAGKNRRVKLTYAYSPLKGDLFF